MPDTYTLYRRLAALPGGRRTFSVLFARKAPYFRTVRPRARDVGPHHAEVVVPKRRAVENHLGTVHAIAVCNGLEAAMGLLAEATTPRTRRWIPRRMEVAYLAKSTTDLLCVAESDPAEDLRGSVAYKRDLVRVLTARAIRRALERAAH